MDKTLHSVRHLRTMPQWPDLLERTGLFQSRCFQTDVAQKIKPVKYKYPPVYDPYGARPPPSDKVSELAERIAALTSEERAQIGPALRASFNHPKLEKISTEGLDLGAQTAAGAPAEEIKAEKTSFDVRLQKFDSGSKLKVIKEVRAITSLGLKEAKALVEKAEKEPAILAQGLTKDEAAALVEKLKAVGGFAAAD